MSGYEALAGRARWPQRILVAVVVMDAVAVVSDVLEYDLLGRIGRGDSVSDATAHANDVRQAVVGGVQLLLLVAAAIFFIRWFQTAYRNLEPLGALKRWSDGWAIGGWFVPVLALWRPKQIANDIWRGSDPARPLERVDEDEPVPPLLQWWWGLFVFSTFVDRIAARGFTGDDTSTLQSGDVADIVSDVADAAAAVLAILVVRAITRRQAARAAARAQLQSAEDGLRDESDPRGAGA